MVGLRGVNSKTKKLQYNMPHLHSMYDTLKGSEFISAVDVERVNVFLYIVVSTIPKSLGGNATEGGAA